MGSREGRCFDLDCLAEAVPFSVFCERHKPQGSPNTPRTYAEVEGEVSRVHVQLSTRSPLRTRYGLTFTWVAFDETRSLVGYGYGPTHAIADMDRHTAEPVIPGGDWLQRFQRIQFRRSARQWYKRHEKQPRQWGLSTKESTP